MINVFKDSEIYIVVPAGVATGGPEILYMLGETLLNKLDVSTFIYFLPNKGKKGVPDDYKLYNTPITDRIKDDNKNILIVPEAYNFLMFAYKFRHIRKVLYWLSVDYFYQTMFYRSFEGLIKGGINYLNVLLVRELGRTFLPHFDIASRVLAKYRNFDLKNFYLISDFSFHITQGMRILEHLKENGIQNAECVFDYINQEFLKEGFDVSQKEDIVCYNPRKGFEFTSKIISFARDIKFVPVVGLDRRGVINLLKKAKVYIDFSPFPGRERIPREAAVLGCCVITGKRGSAKYFEDVPIPEEYKFDDTKQNIPVIVDKIRDLLKNYETKIKDFEITREIVRKEPDMYVENLKKVFVKV